MPLLTRLISIGSKELNSWIRGKGIGSRENSPFVTSMNLKNFTRRSIRVQIAIVIGFKQTSGRKMM